MPKCCRRCARTTSSAAAGPRARTTSRWNWSSCSAWRAADALRAGDEDAAIEHLRTQRTFAQDHLLNWLPMMTEDMRRFSHTAFYQGLAQLVMGYVEEDAAVLEELLDSVEEAA